MLTESDVPGQVLGGPGAGDYRERLGSALGYGSPGTRRKGQLLRCRMHFEANLGFDAGIFSEETRVGGFLRAVR